MWKRDLNESKRLLIELVYIMGDAPVCRGTMASFQEVDLRIDVIEPWFDDNKPPSVIGDLFTYHGRMAVFAGLMAPTGYLNQFVTYK